MPMPRPCPAMNLRSLIRLQIHRAHILRLANLNLAALGLAGPRGEDVRLREAEVGLQAGLEERGADAGERVVVVDVDAEHGEQLEELDGGGGFAGFAGHGCGWWSGVEWVEEWEVRVVYVANVSLSLAPLC